MAGYYAVYNDEYLMHHGVKGMRWGVRRYQSYDVTGPRKGGKTGKELGEANVQSSPSARQLYSKSKKTARVLSRIDRASGKDVAEGAYYHEKASNVGRKINALKMKNSVKSSARIEKKIGKLEIKKTKLSEISKSYGDRVVKAEATIKRILKDSESAGLKLTQKGVIRNATPKAQKRLNAGMFAVEVAMSGLTGNSVGAYRTYQVTGTKYKADKGLKGKVNNRRYSEASSKNRNTKRYVGKTLVGHARISL